MLLFGSLSPSVLFQAGDNRGGGGAAIGTCGGKALEDAAAGDDSIAAQLQGVLHGFDHALSTQSPAGIAEQHSRTVHPQRRCASKAEPSVTEALGIAKEEPRPLQVVRQIGKGFSW